MKGDPRNQAIIVHEDGWAPHSTSSAHSVAAITISTACATKLHRSSESSSRVYSFIPVDQLPSKAAHKYDAFFSPLIREIEELFLCGKKVFFKSAVRGYSTQNATFNVRVIPLLLTADMKAHAEVGLTTAGGKKGCRRCDIEGTYVPSRRHYYYGDYLSLYHNRPRPRKADESLKRGLEVENALNKTHRAELSKQYGITGVCIFYKWYSLCGFDPVNDLSIDTMHVVLNLVRSELEKLLTCTDANNSVLVDRTKLASALRYVPWTSELKDGRIPAITGGSDPTHLGHWKTEEFVKFALVAPYVLHSITSRPHYECFHILHRICQMIFSKNLRINGWGKEEIVLLERLLWVHAITFERLYGIEHCTENLKYSLHIPNDIIRHSSPDNYWCFVYERLVRFYKQQSTNMKNLCKTYIDRACQMRFVKSYLELTSNTTDKGTVFSTDISCENIVLAESTISSAIALKEHIDHLSPSSTIVSEALDKGIAVGSLNFQTLEPRQYADIGSHLPLRNSTLPLTCRSFKKLVKSDRCDLAIVYRVGETIVINDPIDDQKEWVMTITSFILYGPVENKYHIFVDGTYYAARVTAQSTIEVDDWTEKEKMIKKNYNNLRVQPTNLIDHKVMLYPNPNNLTNPNYYLVIDQEQLDYTLPDVPSES